MSLKNSNNLSSTRNGNAKRKPQVTSPKKGSFVKTEKKGAITAYTLPSNGLTVLYARVKGSPTVTTVVVYKVGSRHEYTGETGLAHMLEHMLFKPTTGTGLKWKDLENKGADLNATTWLDRTLYYFNLPKAYFGDMLEVEADRMRNTLLTDEEFLPERSNVLSEYEMYNSRPEMALDWHMVRTAFQSHGYHHDTIGFRSDIEGYTTEKLKAYYDKHYWPENATLIVTGDIPEKELETQVVRHFGKIGKGTFTPSKERVEEEQEGTRRVALVRETPLRLMSVAFKAPAFSSPDWVPLMLGLNYLTLGETSPLYSALVDKGLATQVEAHMYPTHDPFLATFSLFATQKASYGAIETTLLKQIEKAMEKPISAKTLEVLKETLYAEELFSRDGSLAIGLSLAEYVATGDWRRYPKSLEAIEKTTGEDIMRVMKTYLTMQKATVGTLES
jgi:zinc protease